MSRTAGLSALVELEQVVLGEKQISRKKTSPVQSLWVVWILSLPRDVQINAICFSLYVDICIVLVLSIVLASRFQKISGVLVRPEGAALNGVHDI